MENVYFENGIFYTKVNGILTPIQFRGFGGGGTKKITNNIIQDNMKVHKTTLTQAQIIALTAIPTIIILPAPPSGFTNIIRSLEENYNRAGAPNFAGGVSLSYRKDGLLQDLFTDNGILIYGSTSDVEIKGNQKGEATFIEVQTDLKIRSQGVITGGNVASTLDIYVFYHQIKVE